MRLETVKEIAQTCEDFYKQILSQNDKYTWDEFLERCKRNSDGITEYKNIRTGDVFEVDIDYKSMCFTVSNDNGFARLSPIATYYHTFGEKSELDGIEFTEIDIELFEE